MSGVIDFDQQRDDNLELMVANGVCEEVNDLWCSSDLGPAQQLIAQEIITTSFNPIFWSRVQKLILCLSRDLLHGC